jgi:nucleotide-binding universal stress UspA family protein
MRLDTILLTTDLSDASLHAFAPLAALAEAQGSRVTLLHVVEDRPMIPHGAPMAPRQSAPGVVDDTAHARAWVEEHARELSDTMVIDTVVVRSPKVAEAITEYAAQGDFDLIAMATHGHTGVRHLVLGSVAESVLRHADRPVLVFPRHG